MMKMGLFSPYTEAFKKPHLLERFFAQTWKEPLTWAVTNPELIGPTVSHIPYKSQSATETLVSPPEKQTCLYAHMTQRLRSK